MRKNASSMLVVIMLFCITVLLVVISEQNGLFAFGNASNADTINPDLSGGSNMDKEIPKPDIEKPKPPIQNVFVPKDAEKSDRYNYVQLANVASPYYHNYIVTANGGCLIVGGEKNYVFGVSNNGRLERRNEIFEGIIVDSFLIDSGIMIIAKKEETFWAINYNMNIELISECNLGAVEYSKAFTAASGCLVATSNGLSYIKDGTIITTAKSIKYEIINIFRLANGFLIIQSNQEQSSFNLVSKELLPIKNKVITRTVVDVEYIVEENKGYFVTVECENGSYFLVKYDNDYNIIEETAIGKTSGKVSINNVGKSLVLVFGKLLYLINNNLAYTLSKNMFYDDVTSILESLPYKGNFVILVSATIEFPISAVFVLDAKGDMFKNYLDKEYSGLKMQLSANNSINLFYLAEGGIGIINLAVVV